MSRKAIPKEIRSWHEYCVIQSMLWAVVNFNAYFKESTINFSLRDMFRTSRRTEKYVLRRHMIWYFVHTECGWCTHYIALTTGVSRYGIQKGVDRILAMRDNDDNLDRLFDRMRQEYLKDTKGAYTNV